MGIQVTEGGPVLVNFTWQLQGAPGCSDIWSITILGVSLRVFWMRLTFRSVA